MTAGSTLKAGVAEVDVTPPAGVEMCGYGPYEKRVCTEVLDPLYARALWVASGGQAAVLLAVDLCMIGQATRNAVAAELKSAFGLDETRLMLCTSHTHSGPATQRMIGWGECDAAYLAGLAKRLVRAATDARAAAVPARIGAARVRISGVGVNREQPALAPIDTAAQLLRADRADGTPIAVAYNFGAHPVVRYPFTSRISADWPGLVAAYLNSRMHVPALFLQGACGNINAHQMTFERTDVEMQQKVCDMRVGDVAKRFGDQVIPALEQLATSAEGEIASAWKQIDLPCEPPDRAELEATIRENQELAESRTLEQLRPLHERIGDETEPEE